MDYLKLSGKKIIVTGATGGIGKEVCILLSKYGAKICLIGRDEDKLKQTIKLLDNSNEHKYFVYDLIDINNIKSLINDIVKFDNEKLYGLVHCAGLIPTVPLRNISYDYMNKVMKINFYSFVELVKHFSNKRYCSGGSIVAISSYASQHGEKCQTIYSSSKAALDASIRTLSQELYKKNIRINSVRPSIINTGIQGDLSKKTDEDAINKLISSQLLGLGKPEDVANTIAFLLSDVSRFITGRYIDLDGGRF